MLETTFFISQIIVIIAYILLGIGLQKKNRLQILTFSTIYQFLMIVHYSLLLGISGIIASVIALLRNLLFIYNEKKSKNNPFWILILFSIIAVILTICFYKTSADLWPCALTLIGIYSYWCKSTKVTRIGNLLISFCYIVYAISLNSWLSIICELYLIINTVIGYFKYECNENTPTFKLLSAQNRKRIIINKKLCKFTPT